MRDPRELLETVGRQISTHQDKIGMGSILTASGGPILVGILGGSTEVAAAVCIGGVAISAGITISQSISRRRELARR